MSLAIIVFSSFQVFFHVNKCKFLRHVYDTYFQKKRELEEARMCAEVSKTVISESAESEQTTPTD